MGGGRVIVRAARGLVAFLFLFLSVSATAQDARRIVDPLEPAIIDNASIVAVEMQVSSTAKPAVARFDAAAAKRAAKAKRPQPGDGDRPEKADYELLPFAQMLPLVMEDIAQEFNLAGPHRIRLVVTLDTIKQPNAMMAILATSNEEIAGMVEVFDADDPARALGMFHIDVVNDYGAGFGLDALARGAPREFLAREFSRETVRVLAGRKERTRPVPYEATAAP
jgi:hypothetical protein